MTDILTIYQNVAHQAPRKVAGTHGGEFHGPCPACGGEDRFHIWPEQKGGTYWCRSCGKAGDAIQFRRDFMGEDFRTAAAACGKEISDNPAPVRRPWDSGTGTNLSASTKWCPERRGGPDLNWMAHAAKLVAWAHDQLMSDAGAARRQWLEARGIDVFAIRRFCLGWNPGERGKDLYRERKAWGLPAEIKPDGRAKKLWIPRGMVIPMIDRAGAGADQAGAHLDGDVWRVRIRRDEDTGPRYYVLPGSSMRQLVTPGSIRAVVVVESELDAVMINTVAWDVCIALALGSASAHPDADAHDVLRQADRIMVALDRDKAGAGASRWWPDHYGHRVKRWPPIGGHKDPGDMHRAGVDVRAWIMGGLPEAWTIGPCVSSLVGEEAAVESPVGPDGGGSGPETGAEQPHQVAQVPRSDAGGCDVIDPPVDGQHGDAGAPDVPAAVAELVDLLRRHPVGIEYTDLRTRIAPLRGAVVAEQILRRMSRLVFGDVNVVAWLESRPDGVITGRNVVGDNS